MAGNAAVPQRATIVGQRMTSAILVRRAKPADAEAIAVLQDIANRGHLSARDWQREGRDWRTVGSELIASDRTEMGVAYTIVAERDGAVVGMLNYAADAVPSAPDTPVSRPFHELRARLQPCLYLRSMAVLPNERRAGVASRLLDVAMAAAVVASKGAVGVIVHETNVDLLRHYRRRRFVQVASAPVIDHHAYAPGSTLLALRLADDA